MKREVIETRIDYLETAIENFDKSDYISEESYDDMLDNCYGTVTIGSCIFSASRILSELDPIAYRCGYADFLDSVELDQIPEYNELENELEELNELLEELETE